MPFLIALSGGRETEPQTASYFYGLDEWLGELADWPYLQWYMNSLVRELHPGLATVYRLDAAAYHEAISFLRVVLIRRDYAKDATEEKRLALQRLAWFPNTCLNSIGESGYAALHRELLKDRNELEKRLLDLGLRIDIEHNWIIYTIFQLAWLSVTTEPEARRLFDALIRKGAGCTG